MHMELMVINLNVLIPPGPRISCKSWKAYHASAYTFRYSHPSAFTAQIKLLLNINFWLIYIAQKIVLCYASEVDKSAAFC